jgi:3,4-dihydroxy 2-butanone 4-phosphate synthase/GTP cyclohydrolase II
MGRLDEHLRPQFVCDEGILLRIDSGCQSGQVFGDLTCDCREQLHLAMHQIACAGKGMIIHVPSQDGRGRGTAFKLGTLWLQQDLGMDTVEAAECLSGGEAIDVRTYEGAVGILRFFGLGEGTRLNLLTNNPQKVVVLPENGFVVERASVHVAPTEHTRRHLAAKQDKLGHWDLIKDAAAYVTVT